MKIFLSFLLCIASFTITAQQIDSNAVKRAIDSIDRILDYAVVNKQIDTLQKHYAEDFYFKHGSGNIDSKKTWIANVMKPSTIYISRSHDSVSVELHKDIAIVRGTLRVRRLLASSRPAYDLQYFRVFIRHRKTWQLLSHNTIREWDVKSQ